MSDCASHDHNTIGDFLAEQARLPRDDAPIFYNDLASKFGLPPVDKFWATHPLCQIFDSIDREGATNNRPFRTALVISRERGIPGQGFFNTLQELRGTKYVLKDEFEQRRIWQKEFDHVIAYYQLSQNA
ncbi:MAG TPA: hypothetical protein VIK53_05590 [Verrucomicrobiae bacterium]